MYKVLQEPGIIFRSAMFWKRLIVLTAIALCLLAFPCYYKWYFFVDELLGSLEVNKPK